MAIDQAIDKDEAGSAAPKAKSGMGKIVLIIIGALLLVGTSVGASLFLTGVLGGGGETKEKVATEEPKKLPPIYVELGEPFVVNFMEGNNIRYLQVRIEAMTRDSAVPVAIDRHLPRIRNNLVFMFGGFDYASLGTIAGKQRIRDEALAEVRKVLEEEIGNPGVEDIYFTSFVMQ